MKKSRVLIFLLVSISLFILLPIKSFAYQKEKIVKVKVTNLNFRTSPWGKVLGQLSYGKNYKVYGYKKDTKGVVWYKIYSSGRYGYVYSSGGYTSIVSKASSLNPIKRKSTKTVKKSKKAKDTIILIKTGYLNFRTSPWGRKIGVVKKGSKYKVYGYKKDPKGVVWYKIYSNGRYGYVYSSGGYTSIVSKASGLSKKIEKKDRNKNETLKNNIKKQVFINGIVSNVYGKEKIKFNVTSKNIKSPLYQIYITKDDKTELFMTYSNKTKYEWTPKKAGDYLITIFAKSSSNDNVAQVINSKSVVVSSNKKAGFYTNINNRSYVNAPIEFNVVSDKEYNKFKWVYKLNKGKKIVLKDFSKDTKFKYKPKKEGNYEFILIAKNKKGKTVLFSKKIIIKKLSSEINFKKLNSPNYYKDRAGYIPDIIVAHITEGSFESAVNWLTTKESEVSSTFVIAKDGRVNQLLDIEKAPWTNGTKPKKRN